MVVHSNAYSQNEADQCITLKKSILNQSGIKYLENPDMCLFFNQSEGSTGADDSNFRPKQDGGDCQNC